VSLEPMGRPGGAGVGLQGVRGDAPRPPEVSEGIGPRNVL
jgi:hypothetical protein